MLFQKHKYIYTFTSTLKNEREKNFTLLDKINEFKVKSISLGFAAFGVSGIATGTYVLGCEELGSARFIASPMAYLISSGLIIEGVKNFRFWNDLYKAVHKNVDSR